MPENELTIKEEAFYKLSEWLKEFGFAAEESDIRGETGVESKIQFEIDTYLDRGDKYLYLSYLLQNSKIFYCLKVN